MLNVYNVQVIITDLGEIGENAIIVFEENVGVGAEEIVANQEYVTYTGDSEEVLEVKIDNNIRHQTANQYYYGPGCLTLQLTDNKLVQSFNNII